MAAGDGLAEEGADAAGVEGDEGGEGDLKDIVVVYL